MHFPELVEGLKSRKIVPIPAIFLNLEIMNPLNKGQLRGQDRYMWGVGAVHTPHIPVLSHRGFFTV